MSFLVVQQDGCCSGSDKSVNNFFVKKKYQAQSCPLGTWHGQVLGFRDQKTIALTLEWT